ncbi:MAG TPA: hypothetical protein VLW50_12630 [Streptosporangiaceae bacterium]|nr:hypothetical protein [Streptosporangiaceae bacterium]
MTTSPTNGVPGSAVIDGVDVDAVAAAVRACTGVAGLDSGRFGEVASYLPGRKVPGVIVSGGRVLVQVCSQWGITAPDLAALITTVLAPLTGRRPVDVVVADIDDPPGTPGPRRPADGPGLAVAPPA